jgi:hypothetical protein
MMRSQERAMTLHELKGKYARLSDEIDSLAADSVRHEARLLSLMNDLDHVHHELCDLRLRTLGAPTLRDVVAMLEPMANHAAVVPIGVSVAPPQAALAVARPALSMAG